MILIGLIFSSINFATLADTSNDIASIKSSLKRRSPEIKPRSIKPTPLDGIYEVFAGGAIYYMDKTTNYIFFGASLINDSAKKNITLERLEELSSIKFSELPFNNAIVIKKGSGAHKFAVFSDPECPYCKSLEIDLTESGVSDYTAYVFLYPLKQLHPEASTTAESIWCSIDRAETWKNFMVNNKAPVKSTCDNPIIANEKLADEIGVVATPTIYLNSGLKLQNPEDLVSAITQKK